MQRVLRFLALFHSGATSGTHRRTCSVPYGSLDAQLHIRQDRESVIQPTLMNAACFTTSNYSPDGLIWLQPPLTSTVGQKVVVGV